jgi:hypothetical protein
VVWVMENQNSATQEVLAAAVVLRKKNPKHVWDVGGARLVVQSSPSSTARDRLLMQLAWKQTASLHSVIRSNW